MHQRLKIFKHLLSTVILICYLFTFIFGVFHYHNYDFNFSETFDNETKTNNDHSLFLNGKFDECIIHQSFSFIQTAIIKPFTCLHLTNRDCTTYQFPETKGNISSDYFQTNLLRAPPKHS